jgi:hypothetical protein
MKHVFTLLKGGFDDTSTSHCYPAWARKASQQPGGDRKLWLTLPLPCLFEKRYFIPIIINIRIRLQFTN